MRVLVLGGTRLTGVHLVRRLLANGHEVTIATRGLVKDNFSGNIKRKIIDRRNIDSLKTAFKGQSYDAIVDNLAFSSNDVGNLLSIVQTPRYVLTSSVSVYDDNLHLNLTESEIDTHKWALRWCDYGECDYAEGKRLAEATAFQAYPELCSVAVRFPWIFGVDDYTKRLYFYVEHIVKGLPMWIDNINEPLGFISSFDGGNFLAFCAEGKIDGAVNAGSVGTVSLREIIDYVERRTGKSAIIDENGQPAPLSGAEGFSLDLTKAGQHGYKFERISDWLYNVLDYWIEELKGNG